MSHTRKVYDISYTFIGIIGWKLFGGKKQSSWI